MRLFKKRPELLKLYCDGGLGDKRASSGLGVVIRNEKDDVIALSKRKLPLMTNNEAEYAALILGLEAAARYRPRKLQVFMDSAVVVGQMQGRYRVHSAALKKWHAQACRLLRRFNEVEFFHIPRQANRLADALAGEALLMD